MPFALSAGQPRGRASSCRAQARGGRRLAASIAVDGRAALPSVGWVAAGCRLSSSNVPGWVVSQPWWLESVVVAFRRRSESPRAYRPAPRKRGACAADERRRTHDATPAAPTTASPGAHCCAYAPGNAPPAADFSECAPCGHWPAGHTPRNLTGSAACLPSAYGFATRWLRRGLCASRGTTGASPHPPALPPPGKGARGHVRCGGERAAGDGGPGIQAKHDHARKNPQAHKESTPPEGTGKFPLTNCPPLWYSCPRGVASAAAATAALQHLQGSPGAAKARKVTTAFRAFILPPLPTSATIAASNAPNATKPPYFVAFIVRVSHASV